MLNVPITYTDFGGTTRTEIHRFHLSKATLYDMQMDQDGSLSDQLKEIVDEKDKRKIYQKFKWIIEKSYGIKSDDDRRFLQSEEISRNFMQSAAYDAFITKLLSDTNEIIKFVQGIMPDDAPKDAIEAAVRGVDVNVTTPISTSGTV